MRCETIVSSGECESLSGRPPNTLYIGEPLICSSSYFGALIGTIGATRLRTLIIEDDPSHAALSQLVLEEHHRIGPITIAGDGECAVEHLETDFAYDLILVDMRMPRMGGLAFLQWARGQRSLKRTTIAILTTSARTDEKNMSLECGADAFLTKPLRTPHIDELIDIHDNRQSASS